jgi:hypothetical protein
MLTGEGVRNTASGGLLFGDHSISQLQGERKRKIKIFKFFDHHRLIPHSLDRPTE